MSGSGQTFRIEIPIETVDKTNIEMLEKVSDVLQSIIGTLGKTKSKAKEAFDAQKDAATATTSALNDVATASAAAADKQEAASKEAAGAVEKNSEKAASAIEKQTAATKAGTNATENLGHTAKESLSSMGKSASDATTKADRFTKSMQKTEKTIGNMTKTKREMLLELKDKATSSLKSVWNLAKNLASKTFNVAVRLKDMATAPFRKLWNLISNPITTAITTLGIGMTFSDSLATFNDFKRTLSGVKALTGATGEQFASLEEQARYLGATTVFSATEAAQGMQYLAMAGWEVDQVLAAMPGMLDLAAASGTELAVTADIVANVMTAMGMEAKEASRAADVFARAATSSNTSVSELGDTLKYAAPIAHSFGLNLEEVSALAGQMANAGIKGSMAGTAIRSSLLSMATPTKEAAKLMKKLKLEFSNADGSMKDMGVIVRDLQSKFAKLTEEQKLSYAETLFGTYASSAWLGVISQGADAYDKFTQSLINSKGAAAEMASTRLDNLAGDIEELSGAMDEMKISLMDELDPYMRSFVQWLTGQVPNLTSDLTSLITTIAGKAEDAQSAISDMVNSREWQNSHNLFDKMFIAWDTLIIQPFNDWWKSGGQQEVVGIAGTVGETFGGAISGMMIGILSAISGQEIDIGGMNLSPIAKAGIETGTAFFKGFADAFDFKGILSKAPDAIGAIIGDALKILPGGQDSSTSWLSAILVGSGISKTTKLFKGLGLSIGPVKTGLTEAGKALKTAYTTADGAGLAKTAGFFKNMGTLLSPAKSGLLSVLKLVAMVPAPVLIATAAIAAVVIGVKMYSDAMEQRRQELLHMGDSVGEATDQLESATNRAEKAGDLMEEYKSIERSISIARSGMTDTELDQLKTRLGEINSREAEITVTLSEAGLSQAQIDSYVKQLKDIKDKRADIELGYANGSINLATYKTELDALDKRVITITADLTAQGQDAEAVLDLIDELSTLRDEKGEIEFTLKAAGMTDAELKDYEAKLESLGTSLMEISGGLITQYDIENGLVGDKIPLLEKQLELERQIAAQRLRNSIAEVLPKAPALVQEVQRLSGQKAYIEAEQSNLSSAIGEMTLLTSEYNLLALEADGKAAALKNGQITDDDYDKWYDETFTPGIANAQKKYEENVRPYLPWDAMPLGMHGIDMAMDPTGYVATMQGHITELNEMLNGRYSQLDPVNKDLNTAYASLQKLYDGQKELIEYEKLGGKSFEDYASNYADLTGEQKTNFDEALAALQALNEQMNYMPDEYLLDIVMLLKLKGNSYTNPSNAPADTTTQGATGMSQSEIGAFITDLQTQTAKDKGGKPLITRQLMDNEAAYGKLKDLKKAMDQGKTGKDLDKYYNYFKDRYGVDYSKSSDPVAAIQAEITGQRQDIYGNAYTSMSNAHGAIAEIDKSTANLQTQNQDLGGQQANVLDVITKLNAYKQQVGNLTGDDAKNTVDTINTLLAGIGVDKIKDLSELQNSIDSVKTKNTELTDQIAANEAAIQQNAKDKAAALTALEDAFNIIQANANRQVDDVLAMSAADAQRFSALSTAVGDVRTQLENLAKEWKIKINLQFKTSNYTAGDIGPDEDPTPGNANGGIYGSKAFLSWVAEDGPEAIIPLGSKRRDRGVDLWNKAGQMLGIPMQADGGLYGNFRMLDSLSDDGDDDAIPVSSASASPSVTIQTVKVDASFQIKSDNAQGVLEEIRAHMPELADELSGRIAETLAESFSNTPA